MKLQDTSIFVGVIQWKTPAGESWRAIDRGSRVWDLYKLAGSDYIKSRTLYLRNYKPTPDRFMQLLQGDD